MPLDAIIIKCLNCGFEARSVQLEEEEEYLAEIDDEEENDFCPRCFAPIVDVEDEESIERYEEETGNKLTGIEKFAI